jgi:hypothetical protein
MSFEIENDTMEIKGQHTYVNLSMKSQFLDYCLPASIEHAVDRLMVPAWYIYATSIYLFLLTIDEGHGEKTDVPELLLTLRYRDIGGEAHKRRFGIKASLGFLTQNPESKRVALRGMLEPRQLSD